MKNIILSFMAATCVLVVACNNEKKNDADPKSAQGQTQADSLMIDVMDGHDVGMARYGKLDAMQKQVRAVLDSIGKLPAKAREGAKPLQEKMQAVLVDLDSARYGMDRWMSEFNRDSAVDNLDKRIRYLTEEKMKISKIKQSILWSIDKADSLIRAKF